MATSKKVLAAHFGGAHTATPELKKCSPCRFHEGILDGSIMAKDRATAYMFPSARYEVAECCQQARGYASFEAHMRETGEGRYYGALSPGGIPHRARA